MPLSNTNINQDINDPTILETTRLFYNEFSGRIVDLVKANDALTITRTSAPYYNTEQFINITTLLSMADGTNIEISGFTDAGQSISGNLLLYTEAIIYTYVNQAERFRAYFDAFVTELDSHVDRNNGAITILAEGAPINTISDIPTNREGEAFPFFTIQQKDGYVAPDSTFIPTLPIAWSGNGPTDYNYETYPQLSGVIIDLSNAFDSVQPFLSISDFLGGDFYGGADQNDGFFKQFILNEYARWNTTNQDILQTFNGSQDVSTAQLIVTTIKIPVQIANFADSNVFIPYSITITITPRGSLSLFDNTNTGFVNKRVFAAGPSDIGTFNTSFVQSNGSNATALNSAANNSLSVNQTGSRFVIARTVDVGVFQVGMVNQIKMANGSFADWDTEDWLCDVNITLSIDGHTLNKDFTVGLERSMWS